MPCTRSTAKARTSRSLLPCWARRRSRPLCESCPNLLTQAEQVECFRKAARHLTPGGRFVIELWVPELRKLPPGQTAVVWGSEPGYIGLDTYDVLNQHVVSHHFRFDDTKHAQLSRGPHRYIWPAELDLMAQLAGFELETRHADWAGARVHRRVAFARLRLPIPTGGCVDENGVLARLQHVCD